MKCFKVQIKKIDNLLKTNEHYAQLTLDLDYLEL